MSDFKAKMYQIVCRLGLRPRPRWGAYSVPQTPSWILGGLLQRGRDERRREGGEGREKEEKEEKGNGRERRGRGGRGQGRPPSESLVPHYYFPGACAVWGFLLTLNCDISTGIVTDVVNFHEVYSW